MEIFIKLTLSALLPIVASFMFFWLQKRTKFSYIDKEQRDVIIGLTFALIAISSTEWGVNVGGATANCRDASVLCAGLIFSPISGIIAGLIAGVERFFAAYWGVGLYSQVACSVSTFLAGIIAWLLRKYLFKSKRCSSGFGFAIAVVVEVIHLSILLLTHMDDPYGAFEIIKIVTGPMILANAFAVFFSIYSIELYYKKNNDHKKRIKTISDVIQKALLIVVLIAYIVTTVFVYIIQTSAADTDSNNLLLTSLLDVKSDISNRMDEEMLTVTNNIVNSVNLNKDYNLSELKDLYGVTEINLIDNKGIIYRSTQDDFVGFDMNSGEQSKGFLTLLMDKAQVVEPLKRISFYSDEEVVRKYAGIRYGDNGFVQVGYDEDKIHESIGQKVVNFADSHHVSEKGYIIIANEDTIISSLYTEYTLLSEIGIDVVNKKEQIKYKSNIVGQPSYWMFDEAEGYYIISVISLEEAFYKRDMLAYVNSFMEIMVFAALFVLMFLLIDKLIVQNVDKVNNQLARITLGDLSTHVDVRTSREFDTLTNGINSTVDTLKHYIDEANERIDAELKLAKDIQISALPTLYNVFQNRYEFDIYATMNAAKQVGGDFYDFYLLDNTHLAFLVADVSGKSVAGAMFMMRAKTMIKNLAEDGYDIADIFTIANNKLCDGNDAGMFVTAWMGILDTTNGHVVYCNGGHNPPVIYHHDSKFEYLKCRPGFVLAGMENVKYQKYEFDLATGDRIFLYTDGVTEATNLEKKMFTDARLLDTLNNNYKLKGKDLLETVKNEIDEFVGKAEQFDDITMLALDYFGDGGSYKEKCFVAKDEQLDNTFDFIEEQLAGYDVSSKTMAQIKLAFEEAFVNVCHYAYEDKDGDVTVQIKVENDIMVIRIIDSGMEFNPLKATDPNITLSAEERQIGGLGILLVKKVMDSVRYDYIDQKNILTLIKRV